MFEMLSGLGLKKGARVMDIGSQDLWLGSPSDLAQANAFIEGAGGTAFSTQQPLGRMIEAKEVYERAGFEYFCSDVDERPSTIYVDLNKLVFPREKRASADLVVNVGTTEHLANPVGGFALMHYLAKPGALLFHDVPLFGMGNHGLTNPTPKFWHALIWMNRYERIVTQVRSVDESLLDQGNFFHDYLDYFEGLAQARNLSYIVRAVLRKTHESVFIPPYDAVLPDSNGEKEANLIYGALYPFIRTGAWTEKEVLSTIDGFMVLMQKPYRASPELRRFRRFLKAAKAAAKKILRP
jgi:hypothetical protein